MELSGRGKNGVAEERPSLLAVWQRWMPNPALCEGVLRLIAISMSLDVRGVPWARQAHLCIYSLQYIPVRSEAGAALKATTRLARLLCPLQFLRFGGQSC